MDGAGGNGRRAMTSGSRRNTTMTLMLSDEPFCLAACTSLPLNPLISAARNKDREKTQGDN